MQMSLKYKMYNQILKPRKGKKKIQDSSLITHMDYML